MAEKATGSFVWRDIQDHIREHCKADVLFLYDCCHGGAAAREFQTTQRKQVAQHDDRRQEILAAAGIDSVVWDDGPDTWTNRLIDELRLSAKTQDLLTAVDLHSRIVTKSRYASSPFYCKLTTAPQIAIKPIEIFDDEGFEELGTVFTPIEIN
ncbi:hypothetical protein LTR66_009753 [Elasticomyces elasticus]|nr:hypothetical protein LTR66_009753 [Elasticomyces elasticus]